VPLSAPQAPATNEREEEQSAAATSDDLLSVLDQCPLNGRYWAVFDPLSPVGVVDFFDFFSVGFLVCGSRAAIASDLERQQPFCWAAASERSSARWPAGRLVTCGAARGIQMAGSSCGITLRGD